MRNKKGHLLLPFGKNTENPIIRLADAISALQVAHDWLMERVVQYAKEEGFKKGRYWAIEEKRRVVSWQSEKLPQLVGKTHERIGELVNQMATVERLIDTLVWAKEKLPGTGIDICHPTTSGAQDQNDLQLFLSRDPSIRFHFEITDNVGGNNNYKIEETLVKFGLLTKDPLVGYARANPVQEKLPLLYLASSPELRGWVSMRRKVFREDWQIEIVDESNLQPNEPSADTCILRITSLESKRGQI